MSGESSKQSLESAAHSGASEQILYCSFCGKSNKEVYKLIAGPTVFICDECIELCMDIIKEYPPKEVRLVMNAPQSVLAAAWKEAGDIPAEEILSRALAQDPPSDLSKLSSHELLARFSSVLWTLGVKAAERACVQLDIESLESEVSEGERNISRAEQNLTKKREALSRLRATLAEK